MSDLPPPSPLAPSLSPLLEADPSSIDEFIATRVDEIFNKKPPFTEEDLKVMVQYYRQDRLRFMAEAAKNGGKAPAGARKKAPSSVAEALNVNMNDLL